MAYNIAIFASGSGSNAENIINYFSGSQKIKIALILSNNKKAYVLKRAETHQIKSHIFSKDVFYNSEDILSVLKNHQIDFIVLAGFLLLIPPYLLAHYPNKIINIHPALLPKYGGKGMYGHYVHQAVFDNFEKESGITIHYVNEEYDKGSIIFQKSIPLDPIDTPDIIAKKVLELEHEYYSKTIEAEINKLE